MYIYDKLNDLTRAISQSPEYLNYKQAAERIDANEVHSSMLKDFLTAQMQISTSKMLGQEPTEEMIQNFNSLYSTISAIGVINEFLQAQAVFSRIMDDVTKEISKAVSVDAKFLKIIPDFNLDDEDGEE